MSCPCTWGRSGCRWAAGVRPAAPRRQPDSVPCASSVPLPERSPPISIRPRASRTISFCSISGSRNGRYVLIRAAWAVESALSALIRPRSSSQAHPTPVPDAERNDPGLPAPRLQARRRVQYDAAPRVAAHSPAPRTLAHLSTLFELPSADRLLAADAVLPIVLAPGRSPVFDAARDAFDEVRAVPVLRPSRPGGEAGSAARSGSLAAP